MTRRPCRRIGLGAGLLAIALASRGLAMTPYLVKDVNPEPSPASSVPRDFRSFGALALFTAGEDLALDVWRSDGTEAGTFPLAPACGGCRLRTDFIGAGGGQAFLSVVTPDARAELWVSRGRPQGSFRLADFSPGAGPSGLGLWVPEQGRLYFAADDGVHGTELWTSDGTAAGTNLVADLLADASASPGNLISYRGAVYFGANDGTGGALWKSDGTARGTVRVRKFATGFPAQARPLMIGVMAGSLVFGAFSPERGFELWVSDGTLRGTTPLPDFAPARASTALYAWGKLGERLVLLAHDGRGPNLWTTDGTARGTRKISDFRPQAWGPAPYLSFSRGRAHFSLDDGLHGTEPWTSDGTAAGTRLLKDICPGRCSGTGVVLPAGASLTYFQADDGAHGTELWATDGTTAGTRLVRDLCPGSCSSFPFAPFALGGALLFAADDPHGRQLWRSDGTTAGTVRLTDFTDPSIWNLSFDGVATSRLLLFRGEDPEHGHELWRSDGTRAGTYRVADLATADLGGSYPSAFAAAGDRLAFFVHTADHRGVLWTSDGTAEGTALTKDFGPSSSAPVAALPSAAIGNTLYFLYPADGNLGLWKSDGTAAGTEPIAPEGMQVYGYSEVTALGGEVYFAAQSPEQGGVSLWKSDGTSAGTVPVDPASPRASTIEHLTVFKDRLFYFRSDGDAELWSTDGTAAGTSLVAGLQGRFHDSNPPLLAAAGGRLYFFASEVPSTFYNQRLWSTDGTPEGTRRVTTFGLDASEDFVPRMLAAAGGHVFVSGSIREGLSDFYTGLWTSDGTEGGTRLLGEVTLERDLFGNITPVDYGGRLFFVGFSPEFPDSALWVSDGTAAGTRPWLDAGGHPVRGPQFLRLFAGQLVFTAPDPEGHAALWQSDATAAGTRPFFHPGDSGDRSLTVAGGRLYFTAFDPAVGVELWALRPD